LTGFTTDRNDGCIYEILPNGQQKCYLVLPDGERKELVRPLRYSYVHVGPSGPQYPLQDLTTDQKERHKDSYAKFEAYPESESPKLGRYWTQAELDAVNKGCKTLTTMAKPLAETYASNLNFYGATFCVKCQRHFPVDEFVWEGTNERLGT